MASFLHTLLLLFLSQSKKHANKVRLFYMLHPKDGGPPSKRLRPDNPVRCRCPCVSVLMSGFERPPPALNPRRVNHRNYTQYVWWYLTPGWQLSHNVHVFSTWLPVKCLSHTLGACARLIGVKTSYIKLL